MSAGLSVNPSLSSTSGLGVDTHGLWSGMVGLGAGGFDPRLLGDNLKVWYDNQDLSTMFADHALTPASVGSAVALQWDKAKHGYGSDIKSTGTTGMTGTATAATYNTSTGEGTANRVDGSNLSTVRITGVTVGRSYFLDIENTGAVTFSARDDVTAIATLSPGQRVTVFYPAIVGNMRFFPDTNGTSIAFTVHSVREVLGTPRYRTTSAQRPILGRHPKGGRRNLLTYTEQFDNAAWTKTDTTITANAIAAPDGTTTADLLTEGSAGTAQIGQTASTAAGVAHSFSVYLKRGNTDWLRVQAVNGSDFYRLWVNVNTGAIGASGAGGAGALSATSITALPDGWYRVTLTGTIPAAITSVFVNTASANNSGTRVTGGTYYLWGAQLETGSTATAYQKVTSTYDCTETGIPDCYYLQADGSDDGMVTPALDLSATDKIGVFTAVRKLSDAATAVLLESSAAYASNNGTFIMLAAPVAAGFARYDFYSRGTSAAAVASPSSFAAPITSVVTGTSDISGDSAILRVNGAQVATSATDQGAGNYGNYALYFFRRGGSSLPFNGLEYGFALCDTTPSAAQIAAMETYYNNIVGVY